MLKKLQLPREVPPLSRREVSEVSPFAKQTSEDSDLRDTMVDDLEKELFHAGRVGRSLIPDHESRPSSEPEESTRLSDLASLIKELRWEEMQALSEFVCKKVSDTEFRVDAYKMAWALNEFQRHTLGPPSVVDIEE